jgi:hypothetical protein
LALALQPDMDERASASLELTAQADGTVGAGPARLALAGGDASAPSWRVAVDVAGGGVGAAVAPVDAGAGAGLGATATAFAPSGRGVGVLRVLADSEAVVEVGARGWGERWAAGLDAAPFPRPAVKAWLVGAAPAGASSAGTVRWGAQASVPGVDWARTTWRGALSVAAPPPLAYEVSVAVDTAAREAVLGYVHAMTLRRRVWNVLEAAHVKGIFNYLDVGFELRRPLPPDRGATRAVVGAAWQLNKNWLVKGRAGPHDAAVTVAFRSWWDPVATVSATAAWAPGDRTRSGDVALGVRFALEKGGAPEYRKAVRGYQGGAGVRVVPASGPGARDDTGPGHVPRSVPLPAQPERDAFVSARRT